ncbi:hypothetical protein N8343_08440 [Akkermansiaceae bacterium]|nr:hypothetical protein [Akkermansiaceae bacterium]
MFRLASENEFGRAKGVDEKGNLEIIARRGADGGGRGGAIVSENDGNGFGS